MKLTPLQARFARLPMADALQVWDVATNEEKASLAGELAKKKNTYFKAHVNDAPEERRGNRVYQRLLTMFAQGEPSVTPRASIAASTPAPPPGFVLEQ